jgi:hypothetical protein
MPGYSLHDKDKPPFGRIKIVDQGYFALLIDSTGYVEPISYAGAVQKLTELGFEKESEGVENGQNFEIWRLPKGRQTQLEDIES